MPKAAGRDAVLARPKRSTQGKRTTTLEGEEAAKDAEFWGLNNDVWNELESGDESFGDDDVEDAPDEFDSDFDESEDDGDDGDDDSEEDRVRKIAKKEDKSGGGGNKYKEPLQRKKPKAAATISRGNNSEDNDKGKDKDKDKQATKKRFRASHPHDPSDVLQGDSSQYGIRTVRESTKSKTMDAERELERNEHIKKAKPRSMPPIKHHFIQRDLLEEAINTEIENMKWLETQKQLAAAMDTTADKGARPQHGFLQQKSFIRFVTRRGSGNTITFSHIDIMPKFFSSAGTVPATTEHTYM